MLLNTLDEPHATFIKLHATQIRPLYPTNTNKFSHARGAHQVSRALQMADINPIIHIAGDFVRNFTIDADCKYGPAIRVHGFHHAARQQSAAN